MVAIITKEFVKSTKGNLAIAIHHPSKITEKLAILCPGFLNSKDYKGLTELANELARRGYTAVRFDPIGVWESDGNIADYTITQYLADIKAVIDHMLSLDNFTDILLGGHSRGGMVSILYAAKYSGISTVLGIMPSIGLASCEKWNDEGLRFSKRNNPRGGDDIKFIVPVSYVEDLNKYDVPEQITNLKIPVILFAGELDTVVKPEDVEKLYEQANEPKSFTVIPGVVHDYRLNNNEVKIVNKYILEGLGLTEN